MAATFAILMWWPRPEAERRAVADVRWATLRDDNRAPDERFGDVGLLAVPPGILLYSTDEGSEHHAAARDWLDERTAGAPRSVGLPWPSLLAFFRLVTNPGRGAPVRPGRGVNDERVG